MWRGRLAVRCRRLVGLTVLVGAIWLAPSPGHAEQSGSRAQATGATPSTPRTVLDRYCVSCHNDRLKTGGLTLAALDTANVASHAQTWEKVVRKLRAGLMPPAGAPRPDEATTEGLAAWFETELDRVAATRPDPGRTETFHRLNRAEYRNAVRDVLALDVDVDGLLPADTASHGFDNVAGGMKVSESLMERYLLAARQVSRMALGSPPGAPVAQTHKISPAIPQDAQLDGLPFGTRGGGVVQHAFPQDAEYTFRFELAYATAGADLELLIDGESVHHFAIARGQRAVDQDGNEINQKLEVRLPVKAGRRDVAATFLGGSAPIAEANRRPFSNPTVSRPQLAVLRSITVTGPFAATGAGDTPSRRRILSCRPGQADQGLACATKILSNLARHAYRRPVDGADLETLLIAYRSGAADGGFERGIERGVQQMLVSPEFLFRLELDPPKAPADGFYRISDLELASRLSFFLWSSVPDEELLSVATKGRLHEPSVLDAQVRRMLADRRSEAFTTNFAGQWLQLRNLTSTEPSEVLFPDFDDALKAGFRRETELFFDSVLRENRTVVDLLTANYTFVNDRVARHYGIPNVNGDHFRRVSLPDNRRRGLLGQGSILTITSHPTRTSPVFRGKWILENVLGTPPPPPPPNVPALPEKGGVYADRLPSMRERMSQHRANPVCAACHAMIDPLGFGLEQYDPVGRWREVDELYKPIDASGKLPDGTTFANANEMTAALVRKPSRFATALTEKLMTYALGRGLEPNDMPAVRAVVRGAAEQQYGLQSIVLGIVKSVPFQFRRVSS